MKTPASLRHLAIALVLFGAAAARAAEPEFYGTLAPETATVDDVVTLQVTVATERDPSELHMPESPDFSVLSQSQSEQMSFSFGSGTGAGPVMRRIRVYTIKLSPKRTGTFTFKPGRMVVGGKTVETGPLKIKIVAAGQAPSTQRRQQQQQQQPQSPFGQSPFGQFPFGNMPGFGDEPDDPFSQLFGGGVQVQGEKDLFLRAVVDKPKVFLGEQTTLSLYLFSRVEVSQVDGQKTPRLDGFWSEDLEMPKRVVQEPRSVNGTTYYVSMLRKQALFPMRAGKLNIEPFEFDIGTGLSAFISGQRFHRTSSTLTITVLPLPPNAPASFSSVNVGQWRVTSDARPVVTNISTPVTFTLTVEGYGNLKNLELPKLPPVAGLKFFDPTVTQKPLPAKTRFGGTRTAEYLVVPERTGKFEIPAVDFSYFNPVAQAYEKSRTSPIAITVEAGGNPAAGQTASRLPAAPQGQNLLGAGTFRPIRFEASVTKESQPLFARREFLPALAAPWLLWLLLSALGAVRSFATREDAGSRRRRAASRARRRLKHAAALAKQRKADAFYAEVSKVINDYLTDKLGENVTGLTRELLSSRLVAAGATDDAVVAVCRILDACDAGRFAPGGSEGSTLGRVLEDATEAMEAMEARRPAPRPAEATS